MIIMILFECKITNLYNSLKLILFPAYNYANLIDVAINYATVVIIKFVNA